MVSRRFWALGVALAAAASLPVLAQPQKSGPLTLPQALQRTLMANPRLAAADRTIAMAEGRRDQAGAWPNPTVGLEVDNLGRGNNGFFQGVETTLQLSQLFELGGKRDVRVQAALGDYEAARWEREAAKLELLSETTVAFVEALAAQRRAALLERHAGALDKLLPLMQRRVEAGASSPFEVSRVQAAAGLARLEREKARGTLAGARRDLAALMAVDAPDFVSLSGDFGRIVQPVTLAAALKAIEDNPQLMRWTAVRARRDADLLSARLKSVPDVTASIGWRHYAETQDNGLRVGVSVPIPVLDQNRGGIREAAAAAQKTEAERAVNRLTLVATVGKAHDSATSALQQLDLLRRVILPAARNALTAVETGYGQGRFTALEILDAHRTVAEAELQEHDAIAAYHRAIATIEGLIGSSASPQQAKAKGR